MYCPYCGSKDIKEEDIASNNGAIIYHCNKCGKKYAVEEIEEFEVK